MKFKDREEAGEKLAILLKKFIDKQALILALPRGGVPVAKKISKKLKIPLDIVVSRKIGLPENPELAIGAIAPGGISFLDKLAIHNFKVSQSYITQKAKSELAEIIQRQKKYRGDKPPPKIKNKTIILIDDGIATGSTVKAAIRFIQKQHPKKIIIGVPVCSNEAYISISPYVEKIITLYMPEKFTSVGAYYKKFPQVSDEEVIKLLT